MNTGIVCRDTHGDCLTYTHPYTQCPVVSSFVFSHEDSVVYELIPLSALDLTLKHNIMLTLPLFFKPSFRRSGKAECAPQGHVRG